MKTLLTCCLMVVVGVTAETMAQELLPAPQIAPQSYEVAPAPADPTPASPAIAPQSTVTPVPDVEPTMPAYPLPAVQPVVLYPNVRVKGARRIHPLAVPTIVEVPDPRDRHCTVCIEICAPPCECVRVRRHGLLGRKMNFDYGKYEVNVVSRHGVVVVDYDS